MQLGMNLEEDTVKLPTLAPDQNNAANAIVAVIAKISAGVVVNDARRITTTVTDVTTNPRTMKLWKKHKKLKRKRRN